MRKSVPRGDLVDVQCKSGEEVLGDDLAPAL